MAKKKTAKKRARAATKKGPRAKGKTGGSKKARPRPLSRRRTNRPAVAKKAPKTAGKQRMSALAGTKHKKSRIGLTKHLKIKADGVTQTAFRVYGDSIGSAN